MMDDDYMRGRQSTGCLHASRTSARKREREGLRVGGVGRAQQQFKSSNSSMWSNNNNFIVLTQVTNGKLFQPQLSGF